MPSTVVLFTEKQGKSNPSTVYPIRDPHLVKILSRLVRLLNHDTMASALEPHSSPWHTWRSTCNGASLSSLVANGLASGSDGQSEKGERSTYALFVAGGDVGRGSHNHAHQEPDHDLEAQRRGHEQCFAQYDVSTPCTAATIAAAIEANTRNRRQDLVSVIGC